MPLPFSISGHSQVIIRPIITPDDHRAALKEIERLWESKPGTEEFDILGVLIDIVVAYEDVHYPIGPMSDDDGPK